MAPRSSFGTIPSEPGLRRLGVGPSTASYRPVRAQLVVALFVGLMLVAVPLYLWRRPTLATEASLPSSAEAGKMAVSIAERVLAHPSLVGLGSAAPTLEPVVRVGCGASARQMSKDGSRCDRLPFFEDALTKAISNPSCIPSLAKPGTINHVLTVDFTRQRVSVFAGKSGQLKGSSAKKITDCVESALPKPDLTGMPHEYRYYMIAQLARYPGPPPADGQGQLFE